jgi:hypothetical protein
MYKIKKSFDDDVELVNKKISTFATTVRHNATISKYRMLDKYVQFSEMKRGNDLLSIRSNLKEIVTCPYGCKKTMGIKSRTIR